MWKKIIIGIIVVLVVGAGAYYLVNKKGEREVLQAEAERKALPAGVEMVLAEDNIKISKSVSTDLLWMSSDDDGISTPVSLAAEAYEIGEMHRSEYDNLVNRIMAVATPEIGNDADSATAGQRGFRADNRACVIAHQYINVIEKEDAPVEVSGDEVYALIICSQKG